MKESHKKNVIHAHENTSSNLTALRLLSSCSLLHQVTLALCSPHHEALRGYGRLPMFRSRGIFVFDGTCSSAIQVADTADTSATNIWENYRYSSYTNSYHVIHWFSTLYQNQPSLHSGSADHFLLPLTASSDKGNVCWNLAISVGLIHFLCGKSYLNDLFLLCFLVWFHAIAAKYIFAKEVIHYF